MNNTTYDDIWEMFIPVCGYNTKDLPKTDTLRYSFIKQGIVKYNSLVNKYEGRFTEKVKCDNDMEELNCKLKDIELQILVYLMSSIFSAYKLSEFSSVYGVFAKELGIKEYTGQISARNGRVKYFEEQAISLIEDDITTFDL